MNLNTTLKKIRQDLEKTEEFFEIEIDLILKIIIKHLRKYDAKKNNNVRKEKVDIFKF